MINALSVGQNCSSTITSVVSGVANATATLNVTVSTTDGSVLINPNPSFSIADNTTKPMYAFGNVTGNHYTATWGISPNNGNATITPPVGSDVTFTCTANGHVSSPYTVNIAVSGFTGSSTTAYCTSVGSGTLIPLSDCAPTTFHNAWVTMNPNSAYIIKFPNCSGAGSEATGLWSHQVNETVPANTSVTIQGNSTVVCSGAAGTSTWACAATDNTILTDAYNVSNQPLFVIGVSGQSLEFTGITFNGGNLTVTKPNGFIYISGSTNNLRIDHLHLNTQTYSIYNSGGGLTLIGVIYGVADHNRFDMEGQNNGVRSYPGNQDAAWSSPTQPGSANFMFIEKNVFNGGFVNDCDQGGRQVIRYNMVIGDPNDMQGDSGAWQSHTTAQGVASERGCRIKEGYHNYSLNPTPTYPQFGATDGNVGPGFHWGNTQSTGYNNDLVLEENSRVLLGNNCGRGYNVSGGCMAPPGGWGYCGNGSTSVLSVWDGNSNSAGYPCLDQTGRGQGDLLTGGSFPSYRNSTTSCVPTSPPGCSVWPHQMREPIYSWNETTPNTVCNGITISGAARVANRDFYCQVSASANTSSTSPFNGTTGTGFGPGQFRPSTCTAGPGGTYDTSPVGSYGVAYFATDSTGGLTANTLYVCTAANTWTAIYTPYTFPHPLDTGPLP